MLIVKVVLGALLGQHHGSSFSRRRPGSMAGGGSLQDSSPHRVALLREPAKGGSAGFEGTKVKGRAIGVAVPPSRGPWGTLRAQARRPGCPATSSRGILVCETCSNLLPSLGEWSGRDCQRWDWGRREERDCGLTGRKVRLGPLSLGLERRSIRQRSAGPRLARVLK